jgi:hypothetical protein
VVYSNRVVAGKAEDLTHTGLLNQDVMNVCDEVYRNEMHNANYYEAC